MSVGVLWRLRPSSLRGQLALGFALIGALLAVVLSAALGALMAAQSQRDEGRTLHAMARVAAGHLAEGLFFRAREVEVMASSPTLWSDGIGAERVRQAFARSQAVHPHSAWIGVTDARGIVQVATGRLLEGADVSARPWFQAARHGLFVGDVHPAKLLANKLPRGSDGGPQRFVDFSAPIVVGGRMVGVIGVHGSWDWTHATIQSLLPSTAAQRGIEVFVFDRTGAPIYAPGATLQAHVDAGQTLPALAQRRVRGGDPTQWGVVRWADDADYLTAVLPMTPLRAATDLGWTLVVRQPVDAAFAAARQAASFALVVGLFGAAAASAIGWWLTRWLTWPLIVLARAADRTEARPGDDGALAVRGNREVERLSGALLGLTQRLRRANAELERRVAERTEALARANAELEKLAHHDPLTGLLNRRGFDDRAAIALAAARRRGAALSLVAVDADHFKRVNDTHGHDVGDQVLCALGEVLRRRLREVDIVARVGGEEFVALLPDTDGDGACHVAAALVERIAALPMPVVGRVTVSCGVAELRVGREPMREALARADAALYEAKRRGRNRWHFAAVERIAEPVTCV